MNWGHAIAMGTVSVGFVQALSAATILTGEGLANNVIVTADHGSNEAGTPNVALDWSTSGQWDNYSWPNGGGIGVDGSVYQVDGTTVAILFTPEAGFNVLLTSIDGNDWAGGGGDSVYDWSVVGSVSGTLGSGTGVVVPDGTVSNLDFANLTGASAETLTLTITQTGGSGSYFAMDNLAFDQVAVPEPSSTALLGLGLGAMAMRRRRK